MADTIGLLQQSPKAALVSLLNEYNGTDIKPADVEFSNVGVVAGRRTRVTVSPVRRNNPFISNVYKGQVEFQYNRLDLTALFQTQTLTLNLTLPVTTKDVLEAIKTQLGFVLEPTEFEIEYINFYNAAPYRLKAKTDSLRWIGYVDIDVVQLEAITDTILTSDLGTLVDPLSAAKTFVVQVQPTTDGVLFGQYLSSLELGEVYNSADLDLDVINRLLPNTGEWVMLPIAGTDNNLYGAEIVGNSYNTRFVSNEYNKRLTRTLLIKLSDEYCGNYHGMISIQYSMKYDEPIDTTPPVYKLPVSLYQSAFSGYLVANQIIQLQAGDILTTPSTDWEIGRVVFNGAPWVIDETPQDFNAYGAEVLYNGFNNDYPKPANFRLTHVLVLKLGDHCENLTGVCYIHYNLNLVA